MKAKRNGGIPKESMNKILASLPTTSQHWLNTLELVTLSMGTMNAEGSTVQIGLVGNEGMVGVPAILGGVTPYRAVVQMSGDAFRVSGQNLCDEFRHNPFLRDLLLKYTNAFIIQIAQSSICNCYHTLQERLCRWLLVARDAVQSDVLFLTHDLLARLLGTRRASVTVAAGLLQRAGLIRISRG